ncbi:MAG: efflux RND transporter periplasmic adaptor subunit [Bacteroidota bacterium]
MLLWMTSCGSDTADTDNRSGSPIPAVEAIQARFGSLPLEERLSGVVRAENQIEIYPRISAPVEEVYVENGDPVRRGDPLVRLESREYEERLNQAKASLRVNEARARQARARADEINSEYRRQEVLAERDLISTAELEMIQAQQASAEAEYDLAVAQVDQARSTVSEMENELSRTVLRSPIEGVVGGRTVEIGMQVSTSNRLFVVGDISRARVLVSLTENMLGYIESGQTARILSESFGDTLLYSEVSRISPFLEAGNFSTQAEIELENDSGHLLPGMFVTVDILYGESEQATIVPLSAIYRHPRTGIEGIYVAPGFGVEVEPVTEVDSDNPPPLSEPTELEFRPIEVIARGRESAGVVGIDSGDWIVTIGQSMMVGKDDMQARIRAATWERILAMQSSQPQRILRQMMELELASVSSSQGS